MLQAYFLLENGTKGICALSKIFLANIILIFCIIHCGSLGFKTLVAHSKQSCVQFLVRPVCRLSTPKTAEDKTIER
jgi:hypothetical protein